MSGHNFFLIHLRLDPRRGGSRTDLATYRKAEIPSHKAEHSPKEFHEFHVLNAILMLHTILTESYTALQIRCQLLAASPNKQSNTTPKAWPNNRKEN